jgi:hypothetical protein
VNYTGTSSMEIGIKVIAENIRTQVVRHANSCFFTMVAVDDHAKPTPVTPLTPSTPEEERRYKAAKLRRQLRQELEQPLQGHPVRRGSPPPERHAAPDNRGMAKEKTVYTCSECGGISPKWLGKCPHCNAWNTLEETRAEARCRKQEPHAGALARPERRAAGHHALAHRSG